MLINGDDQILSDLLQQQNIMERAILFLPIKDQYFEYFADFITQK